jgi:hypothetical protein
VSTLARDLTMRASRGASDSRLSRTERRKHTLLYPSLTRHTCSHTICP